MITVDQEIALHSFPANFLRPTNHTTLTMEIGILSDEELADLRGYKARAYQRRWLTDRQWGFVEGRGKRPLVGRIYARMITYPSDV